MLKVIECTSKMTGLTPPKPNYPTPVSVLLSSHMPLDEADAVL